MGPDKDETPDGPHLQETAPSTQIKRCRPYHKCRAPSRLCEEITERDCILKRCFFPSMRSWRLSETGRDERGMFLSDPSSWNGVVVFTTPNDINYLAILQRIVFSRLSLSLSLSRPVFRSSVFCIMFSFLTDTPIYGRLLFLVGGWVGRTRHSLFLCSKVFLCSGCLHLCSMFSFVQVGREDYYRRRLCRMGVVEFCLLTFRFFTVVCASALRMGNEEGDEKGR